MASDKRHILIHSVIGDILAEHPVELPAPVPTHTGDDLQKQINSLLRRVQKLERLYPALQKLPPKFSIQLAPLSEDPS